jgi:hypothetical protein
MTEKPKWEVVAEDTERLPVRGGWLYRTRSHGGIALCFVPTRRPATFESWAASALPPPLRRWSSPLATAPASERTPPPARRRPQSPALLDQRIRCRLQERHCALIVLRIAVLLHARAGLDTMFRLLGAVARVRRTDRLQHDRPESRRLGPSDATQAGGRDRSPRPVDGGAAARRTIRAAEALAISPRRVVCELVVRGAPMTTRYLLQFKSTFQSRITQYGNAAMSANPVPAWRHGVPWCGTVEQGNRNSTAA